MKKSIYIFAAISLSSLVLSACGSKNDGTSTSKQTTQVENSSPTILEDESNAPSMAESVDFTVETTDPENVPSTPHGEEPPFPPENTEDGPPVPKP
ncbi:hypothetical protein FACS189418_4280 [Clostridia bacterium]|nr:hypothetical protein FACS189418_4280 [Clostridia bacterium]